MESTMLLPMPVLPPIHARSNITSRPEDAFPLHPAAIILPVLAFPAWILDILPMTWHFSQGNIAAGTLIFWIVLQNFFNSINPLIWPRDNMTDWWDGEGYCDIHARIQVGSTVALASSVTMVMRKLAKVMDTRNITIAPSKRSKAREKALDILWCWVYPCLLMVVYYIVQPFRYFIFGISGCVAAYDSSWPSAVLIFAWGPITMCFAAYYSGLLIYRLHSYRREFSRLIAARNTTKSRFLRLFVMAMTLLVVYTAYSLFIFYSLASRITDKYSWDSVHGPNWNTIVKVPALGIVRFDKWGHIASGYLAFLIFGTGSDAHNTYRLMLLALSLGHCFPSLYVERETGTSTPASFAYAKGLCGTLSSRAKTWFSRRDSVLETLPRSAAHDSFFASGTPTTSRSAQPIVPQACRGVEKRGPWGSRFGRWFTRRTRRVAPVLPLFGTTATTTVSELSQSKSPMDIVPPAVFARAWSSGDAIGARVGEGSGGVHIVQELQQHCREKTDKDTGMVVDGWA